MRSITLNTNPLMLWKLQTSMLASVGVVLFIFEASHYLIFILVDEASRSELNQGPQGDTSCSQISQDVQRFTRHTSKLCWF